MKQTVRTLCAVLAAVLLLSACSFAVAEEEAVTVFIPSRVERLDLPEKGSTYDGDPFMTGYEGAKTHIERETVTIKSVNKNGKVFKDDVTYVSCVTTTYPKGNYIRKVVAKYKNDKKNTLAGYIITYETAPDETYTVTYAPKTATIMEMHNHNGAMPALPEMMYAEIADPNAPSETLYACFTGGVGAGLYLHHYDKDEILEGVYRSGNEVLYSGGGKQIKNWFSREFWSGKATKSKKAGLKPVTSFTSPRVD